MKGNFGLDQVRFRCLLVGERALAAQCGEMLEREGHTIAGVLSADASLVNWAQTRQIPVLDLSAPGHLTQMLAFASGLSFDYLFSIVNGTLIPAEILQLARCATINFHDALLPEYAGFNTTTHAIARGENEHGITWHSMEGKVDSGPIWKQVRFPVAAEETAFSLNVKCYDAALSSFAELIAEIGAGTAEAVPQDLSRRKFYSRYKHFASGCRVPWEKTAKEVEAMARSLDFGPYANPIGVAKLRVGETWLLAGGITLGRAMVPEAPGTITLVAAESLGLATASGEILISRLQLLDGPAIPILDAAERFGIRPGMALPSPADSAAARATALHTASSPHESYWAERLSSLDVLTLEAKGEALAHPERIAFTLPAGTNAADALAAAVGFWGRNLKLNRFDLGYSSPALQAATADTSDLFAPWLPLRCEIDSSQTLAAATVALEAERTRVEGSQPYLRCLPARYPNLRESAGRGHFLGGHPEYPVLVQYGGPALAALPTGSSLLMRIAETGDGIEWLFDSSADYFARMAGKFRIFLAGAFRGEALGRIPLVEAEEARRLTVDLNRTQRDYDASTCIHTLIEAQVERQPAAPALRFEATSLTYAELNARANRIAVRLREMGVGPEAVVGILLERSTDMVAAMLAVWKAGGAYLPLDPGYPADRTAFILEDAGAQALIVAGAFGETAIPVLNLDAASQAWEELPDTNLPLSQHADSLAYLIYTSGSTGRPKGVEITHRNVANFFAGMDERIEVPENPVWLALTSISFDISVLELFWTLTRGFHVVLASEEARLESGASVSAEGAIPAGAKPCDFSLFYFANNAEGEGANGVGRYRLLLEGAKFGDANDFAAVWTPERHFHAFGGLYPNPAVTSAALAASTSKIRIRAGSVVLPLHSPIRVAEEWSLVDNLSQGRVGISFAAGWNERDFVFAPANYAKSRDVMFEYIEIVRKLWRGEAHRCLDGKGNEAEIRTLPRPIQAELPVWVTAAGNPDTFRQAGARGYNLLTHLLGQKIEQLAEKIAIYRAARREAGFDPEAGRVTLMLHTFVGESLEEVRETVRAPFTDYLKTSLDLIKNSPWSFPAFSNRPDLKDQRGQVSLERLTEDEMSALLEHAFDRYFETSGLFGTVDQCVALTHRLSALGVDEIACLIDFGLPTDTALDGLRHLNEVRRRSQGEAASGTESAFAAGDSAFAAGNNQDYSVPALLRRHRVTHLQCTPSMARVLMSSAPARTALGGLHTWLVGGEALPLPLAQSMRQIVKGQVINVYGPTETTVWSTAYTLPERVEAIRIGTPLANQQIYVVDAFGLPVPFGEAGELWIGGDGVARGYRNRPDLNAERFVADAFRPELPQARLYRTGDLVRYQSDGQLEYLGRMDFQVKIRGHRIEIGEIEAALAAQAGVEAAVVMAREDAPGDTRLVAYVVGASSATELRQKLGQALPEAMIPSAFVFLAALPLTPNKKVDRKALPAPEAARPQADVPYAAPTSDLEQLIAGIWRRVLRVERVGLHDNFFDLGGHSLLIVEVNAELKRELRRDISVVQMFRFPTISSLAAYLNEGPQQPSGPSAAAQRAAARRSLRGRETSPVRN